MLLPAIIGINGGRVTAHATRVKGLICRPSSSGMQLNWRPKCKLRCRIFISHNHLVNTRIKNRWTMWFLSSTKNISMFFDDLKHALPERLIYLDRCFTWRVHNRRNLIKRFGISRGSGGSGFSHLFDGLGRHHH